MKLILTGGGSAGHVTPCIALLPCLREYFSDICYLGRADGIERRLAEMNGIKFHPVNAVKFDRSSKLSVLKIPCSLSRAVSHTKKLLKELRPDVLFAKGGYVSLPGALAARSLKIPVVCHESDFSLGLANKVISRFAECTLTSFEATAAKRSLFVGNPVRAELTQADPQKARRTCAFSRTARVALFVGGSGGAEAINRAVDDALPSLVRDFNVVHICGQGNLRPSAPGYRCFEFVDDIFDLWASARYLSLCRQAHRAAIRSKTQKRLRPSRAQGSLNSLALTPMSSSARSRTACRARRPSPTCVRSKRRPRSPRS